MDALKRNGFWILCGLLVAGGAGFYALGVLPLKSEIDTQAEALQGFLDADVSRWRESWAKTLPAVPSDAQIQAHLDRASALAEELKNTQALLKTPHRWKGLWGPEAIQNFIKFSTTFRAAYEGEAARLLEKSETEVSGFRRLHFLADAGATGSFQLALPDAQYDIPQEAKRLMLQMELVDILNRSEVLSLPAGGIRFTAEGGKPGAGAKGATPSQDSQRLLHPFDLKVQLDLRNLPKLLSELSASSFNLGVKSLSIKPLEGTELDKLVIDKGLARPDQREELIQVDLTCEAVEFLVGEEKKP